MQDISRPGLFVRCLLPLLALGGAASAPADERPVGPSYRCDASGCGDLDMPIPLPKPLCRFEECPILIDLTHLVAHEEGGGVAHQVYQAPVSGGDVTVHAKQGPGAGSSTLTVWSVDGLGEVGWGYFAKDAAGNVTAWVEYLEDGEIVHEDR